MSIQIDRLSGAALQDALPDIARLRIEVFRAFPYLYDGDAEYEAQYLRPYVDSSDAIVVGAWDSGTLVGVSTGTPMEDHAEAFGTPFIAQGYNLSSIFYCAESVLLPDYRGRGFGHAFFDKREAHARSLGRSYVTFCSVVRPHTHPARPPDYAPLDAFWHKRGYASVPDLTTSFGWTDIGDLAETQKPMQFWMRSL